MVSYQLRLFIILLRLFQELLLAQIQSLRLSYTIRIHNELSQRNVKQVT